MIVGVGDGGKKTIIAEKKYQLGEIVVFRNSS
jgi:hypothetical protein